jgi:hypothetical protein
LAANDSRFGEQRNQLDCESYQVKAIRFAVAPPSQIRKSHLAQPVTDML